MSLDKFFWEPDDVVVVEEPEEATKPKEAPQQ